MNSALLFHFTFSLQSCHIFVNMNWNTDSHWGKQFLLKMFEKMYAVEPVIQSVTIFLAFTSLVKLWISSWISTQAETRLYGRPAAAHAAGLPSSWYQWCPRKKVGGYRTWHCCHHWSCQSEPRKQYQTALGIPTTCFATLLSRWQGGFTFFLLLYWLPYKS